MSNSKLARKLRVKLQLRDKKGRWIEMGRGAKWLDFNGNNVSGVVIGSKGNVAIVRQKNADGTLTDQNVNVNMNQLEMINEKANLDPATIELVNKYKDGQSSKDQKETEAREKALAEAKTDPEKAGNLAEIEYEVSLQEELTDAYDRAPVGSTISDSSDQVFLEKNEDGKWVNKLSGAKYSSDVVADDDTIAEEYYATTGDETEAEISQLFKKITEEYNDPDDTKATLLEGADDDGSSSSEAETDDAEAEAPAFTIQDLKQAPVGAKLEHKDGLVLTKNEAGKWISDSGMPFTSDALLHAGKPGDFKADFLDSPAKSAIQVSKDAPIDISDWKYHQGTQGGSNPGGVYTAPDGQQYYVKHSKSDMHAKNEVLADKFYEALGVKTSKLKIADVGGGKLGTASAMVEGSKNDFYSKSQSDPAYLKKFQEDFAIDAWLANWDVVGLEYDNALTDADGNATRIDPGGALLYRAMGSPKGDMFGEEVGEWESMRNGSNPASKIFGSMSDEDLKASVAKLKNISNEDIAAIVDSMDFEPDVADFLKNTLAARRENLLAKYPELATEAETPQKDFPTKKKELQAAAQNGEIIDPTVLSDGEFTPDLNEEIYAEWENMDENPAYKDLIDGFTESEMLALKDYVQSSDAMNWLLRGNKNGYDYLTQNEANDLALNIPSLDGLIAKSVIKEDTTVYRGVPMSNDRFKKFMDSKMYSDLGFSSTSISNTLATGWGATDEKWDDTKTEVVMEIKLPKGFTAHRVNYDASGTQFFSKEEEVILPRGTDFDIVNVEEYTKANGYTGYRLTVEPILTEKNYKPEEVSNGQGSNESGDSGNEGIDNSGDNSGVLDPAGTEEGQDAPTGGSDDSADTGTSGTEESSEPSTQGSEDPAVVPETEAPVAEEPVSVAPAAEEPSIAPINGAKVMQAQWAAKEGLTVEAWKEKHNVPESGLFPNKNKTVTNENGEEFVANAIVSNPKFGQGIASIILPSTNSVKVLYAEHGYKVTQAKNLSLVGDVPEADIVPEEAIDLSSAKPGDVGTNPVNGKMYFVGKDGNALYIGDEVSYTKKGVTQTGKVSSIYKGAQTVKVDWDEGDPSVKKASQIFKKESDEATQPTPAPEEAPEAVDTPEEAPAAPEQADTAPEAAVTPSAPAEPSTGDSEPTNKGWTPEDLGTYDPMGPTTVQIYPDLKTAKVYAHDHSGNQKQDYALKGTTGYNPVEQKNFGVGINLQPLYVGDKVNYLWLGQKYEGKIVDIAVTSKTAKVELADGTIKLKKFSQLRGNYPKIVEVDENGNYTDWYGNAAKIPGIGSENTSAPEPASEAAPPLTLSFEEFGEFNNGQIVSVDGVRYHKIGYSWYSPQTGDFKGSYQLAKGKDVAVLDNLEHSLTKDQLDALGDQGIIRSEKLGITATKDIDGDWWMTDSNGTSFPLEDTQAMAYAYVSDDWEILSEGKKPAMTAAELASVAPGSKLDLGGNDVWYKLNDNGSNSWWKPSGWTEYDDQEMQDILTAHGEAVRPEEALTSNLDSSDLDDMNNGAEIISYNLGISVTKDSDGDWNVDSGSFGYLSGSEVIDLFHTDDWEIVSTGQVESNYSAYDLDSAEIYSELYSPTHGADFMKNSEGVWENQSSGVTYTAEELLTDYPDDSFTLTESEIDESYSYGMDSSDLDDLELGSKISHTDTPTDAPSEYMKIGDDEWVDLDYSGQPDYSSTYSNSAFEDGYSVIVYEASEDEYTAPEMDEYEPNTPNKPSDEVTLEWLESVPVGSKVKASISEKWIYTKTGENEWTTSDKYGKKGSVGTNDSMVTAVHNKNIELQDIYVPGAEDNAETPVSVADFEAGTQIPVNDTTSFTKAEDGEWKMTINGTELQTPVNEALVQEALDNFKPEVIKPEPVNVPEAEVTPESESTPEATEAPSAAPLTVGEATIAQLMALPVGTTVDYYALNGDLKTKAAYKKTGADEWSTPGGAKHPTSYFEGVVGHKVGTQFSIVSPEGESSSSTAENVEHPKNLNEVVSMDQIHALPVGTEFISQNTSETLYTKVGDNKWESKSGTIVDDANFEGLMGLDAIIKTPESSSDAPVAEKISKDMYEYTPTTFADLPVGSEMIYTGLGKNQLTYKKTGENEWTFVDQNNGKLTEHYYPSSDFDGFFSSAGQYAIALPEETSANPKLMSEYTPSEFLALPIGSKVVKKDDTSKMMWEKKSNGLWGADFHSEGVFDEVTYSSYLNGGYAGTGYLVVLPETEESSNNANPVKTLKEYKSEDVANLPLGTTIVNLKNPEGIFAKTGADEWTLGPNKFNDSLWTTFIESEMMGAENYKVVLPESVDVVEPVATKTYGLGELSSADIPNLPEGTVIQHKNMPSKVSFTKTAEGWVSKSNGTTHPDSLWDPVEDSGYEAIVPDNGEFTPTPASTSAVSQPITDFTLADLEALPTGSKIQANNADTYFTKNEQGTWKTSLNESVYPTDTWDPAGMTDYLKSIWKVTPAGGTPQPSGKVSGVAKGVKISDQDLDAYPVGTTLKKENPAYFDKPHSTYFVKQDDGSWQEYSKTAHTLQTKQNYLPSQVKNWYGTFTASVPSSGDHFVSGLGEIGYVGDSVAVDGQIGEVLKIMKTGIKVKLHDGTKVTVKPAKVTKGDPTFGFKPKEGESTPAPAPTPVAEDSSPSKGFAGADAEEYNKQGIVTPSNPSPTLQPNFTLTPSHEVDTTNPLYGSPKPVAPPAPNAYPHFEPPQLTLPEWDSAEWLKKVEQRYLDNPNKAKATVQESNKWSSIENVLKGEKQNLDNLLSSKYLDDDLYAEAVAGIDKQSELNAPLVEEHKKTVADAKAEYEAKKTAHLADYTELKAQYDTDLNAWLSANPDPNAMKLAPMPETSKENFTGGEADWSKAHIGTFSAKTAFEAIKADNSVGRHGLSVATDADKIENLDVKMMKIISAEGTEAFDLRFKVTADHGKNLDKFFKSLPASQVKKSSQIYPPQLQATDSGILKDKNTGNYQNSGSRYEYVHEATGARVIFQRASQDKEFNSDTNHNSVRIVLPASAGTVEYQQVLEHLGIDAKPASEGDIRVYAENRLITMFGSGKTAIGHKNLSGPERNQVLKSIETKYGITVDDLSLENEINGRVRLHFNPKTTKMLAERFKGIKTFQHVLQNGNNVDMWLNLISGPNPGLLSTYHRWSHGVGFSGQSSGTDLTYGSGDYVYTSPSTNLGVGGDRIGIHPEAIFRRADLWANMSDQYGKKSTDGHDMGAFEKFDKWSSGVHEVLPQDTVPISDFQYISVGSSSIRTQLLEKLKAKGILQINGIDIEDFILTSGMTPPAMDYIPGYGAVPAGTVIPETGGTGGEGSGPVV